MARHTGTPHHLPVLHLIVVLVSVAIALSALADPTFETPAKVFTVTLFAGLALITVYHAQQN